MAFHPNFTQLGNLQIVEVYEFYDRPLLFSCRNSTGHHFLALLIDETETEEVWLYAPVSETRFAQIRAGKIDLHDAFAKAEDDRLYEIHAPHLQASPVEFRFISVQDVPEDVLPLTGESLDIKVQTLPEALTTQALKSSAEQSRRELVTLRLTLHDQNMTEAPAELLGGVLQKLQDLLTAIALSFPKHKPKKVNSHQWQVNVQGFAHSSFAVSLASDISVDMFGDSEVGWALSELVDLIELGDDPEKIQQKIKQLKPRVAVGYAMFLKSLGKQTARTQLDWASPKAKDTRSANITSEQARNIVTVIERTELHPPETIVINGTLVGANLRGKIFEISAKIEGKHKKFSGRIDDQSLEKVRGAALGMEFKASMVQTLSINFTTGETESKYVLISLESQ